MSSSSSDEVMADNRYVAFCDILGFSSRLLSDFNGTLEIYKQFADTFSGLPGPEAEITMYSGALLITGTSAATRASQLMSVSPSHKDKYLWFLALHEAVGNSLELVPHDLLARFIRDGVLKMRKT